MAATTPKGRGRGRDVLCEGILLTSLLLMAILAIPVLLFIAPIVAVWTLTDKLLRWLEAP